MTTDSRYRFTDEQVQAAVATAVRIKGPDYVYRNPGESSSTTSLCFYSTAQYDAGYNDRSLQGAYNEGSALCIVGYVSRILGFDLVIGGAAGSAIPDDVMSPVMRMKMQTLQIYQDQRKPWGVAYLIVFGTADWNTSSIPDHPYTYEEVTEAARTAIRIMGSDYVYRSGIEGVAGNGKCFYSSAEHAVFAAARAEQRLESPFNAKLDAAVNSGSAACIVGFISRILDFPLQRSGSALISVPREAVDAKAHRFLRHLQAQQDNGKSWGEAYERAALGILND